jgi:hypothetical protein
MLVLAFAVTACRSVPSEVAVQHSLSMQESDEALVIASNTLIELERKSIDMGVADEFGEWLKHVEKLMEHRGVVHRWLVESKAGEDVIGPYATGHKLLMDMHRGFYSINAYWKDMLTEENDEARAKFIELFRKDIERFRVLERKFDEWISQFRVKG